MNDAAEPSWEKGDLVGIKGDAAGTLWRVKTIASDGELLLHLPTGEEKTLPPDDVCGVEEMIINWFMCQLG